MKITTICLIALLLGLKRDCLGIPILDQSNTSYSSGEFLGGGTGNTAILQTFTPGISGQLAELNLLLDANGGSQNNPLIVSVYNTQNGLPQNRLGSENLYNISGDYFAWYMMDFSSQNIQLNANTLYALVFTHPVGSYVYVRGTVNDSYLGGTEFLQTSSDPSWQPDTRSRDISFQTFMTVPDAPSVSTVVLSVVFLIACRHFLRPSNA